MGVDEHLQEQAEGIFIKQPVDMEEPRILAAMVTSAANVARATDLPITFDLVVEELLDAYGKVEDDEVTALVGMHSGYVKGATGFSVETEDYAAARSFYQHEKENCDRLYNGLLQRSLARENEEEKNL